MKLVRIHFWLILTLSSFLAIVCLHGIVLSQVSDDRKEVIILGKWDEAQLDDIMRKSSRVKDLGRRIDFLSQQFLGVDYEESTLIGDISTPEVFVVNVEGMDCFTYMDYVEAMRLSGSFSEFKENLRKIRYKYGKVSFQDRNHFFTDWPVFNGTRVADVTEEVGRDKTKTVLKILNKKEDRTYFLPGIPTKERNVAYIPSDAIDDEVLGRLKTGDYVGIYSDMEGLDVSHTGIIIKEGDKIYLRHASSREANRKVVDEDLKTYLSGKPGLVVFRPK